VRISKSAQEYIVYLDTVAKLSNLANLSKFTNFHTGYKYNNYYDQFKPDIEVLVERAFSTPMSYI